MQVSDSFEALASQWAAVPYSAASARFVLGDVRPDAQILLIGEAPGEEEDEAGRAFVGQAGRRLNISAERADLKREGLSIGNIFPRRPDNNREPTADEIKLHSPYVDRLVRLHPNLKAVGLMGGSALLWKTGREKIKAYRGEEYDRDGLWWLPMFHPAAILYRPSDMKWLVQDLGWIRTLAEGDLLDTAPMSFELAETGDQLRPYFPGILGSAYSYLDVETAADEPADPLWWWDGRVRPVLFSFGWFDSDGQPRAVVVKANESTLPAVKELLESGPLHWCGSGALYFDVPMLDRIGIQIACRGSFLDSLPIAKLNDENRGCGAKDLAKRHLRAVHQTPYWGEHEEGQWHMRWGQLDSMSADERAERVNYSGKDAWLGVQTIRAEAERLRANAKLVKAYRGIIIGQSRAIAEMHRTGLPLDLKAASEMSARLGSRMAEVDAMLQETVPDEAKPVAKSKKSRRKSKQGDLGIVPDPEEPVRRDAINFSSSVQVSRLLFGQAGLPPVKTTPSGDRASADRFVLMKCLDREDSKSYPEWAFKVIHGVLELRELEKARGYVDSLIEAAGVSHDGRVHSTLKIGPVTWRIASEDPNVQQLQGEGTKYPVKPLFVAPVGWKFVKHDYKALEVCGLADQSGDPKLIERIRVGEDLHWRHATGFMGWDYEMMDRGKSRGKGSYEDKCRQAFKTLYFAGGYGAGPGKLADTVRDDFYRIGVERGVVRSMIAARKARVGKDLYISLARAWMDWIASEYPVLKASFNRIVMEIGKTTTVVGKFAIERRLPEIWDPEEQIQSEAGRQGYNFRPQNLSLLTFIAYRELEPIRRDFGAEEEILLALQEHDSLLWLVREEHAALWDVVAKSKMENIDWSEWGTSFAVPLTVESYIGDHWG